MSEFMYEGKRIHYERYGEGEHVLLFAHGNTASGAMFVPFMEALPSYTCYLIDFMGHGQSERISAFPPHFWQDQGRQLLALIKEIGKEKVSLIGTSGGAIAALNAALMDPSCIHSVVADSFEGERSFPPSMHDFEQERAASLQDRAAIAFYQAMQGEDYADIVQMDTKMILEQCRQQETYVAPLAQIQVPVLLTGSEQDDMIPDLKDIYADLCAQNANYQQVLFAQGRHPACYSNAPAWIQAVAIFLNQW